MPSQGQQPTQDPYFSLDMRRCPDGDAVEVLLTGALDERTVEHLADGLTWVVAHMPQRDVVVDLAGICRFEPCGVGPLLRVRGDLRACGRTLAVRAEPAGARPLLATAGLLDAPAG
ncbi:STAS domain-containing protein [Nocardioides panacis]|uniref:STAS domain-containing protein n=1 Tax=Nocardioides panacis TaxID=2849501 RepID=A0A975T0L7_9ACTN|nr:STAS domain-containing protein [Nocardioides panacis]QWZ09356.1 STAS domain-containing protein [Nocardioides panacis]